MSGVEAANGLQAVDTGSVLSGRVVTCPLHQALEFLPAAKEAGVEHLVHAIPVFAVDYDRWLRWLTLAGERVGGGVF